MAKYTMELRRVCDIFTRPTVESWFTDYELSDYLLPIQIQTITQANIWSKDKLAKKIVDHYFVREIGLETPALFQHYAKVKMREIMEKWLPYIYTNSIEYNPLESVNFTITEERNIDGTANSTNDGTSNSKSNSTASGLNIGSDTPQGQVNKDDILNGTYATNTNASETDSQIIDNTTTNSTAKADTNTRETLTHQEIGNKGVLDSYQKQILMFRDNIIAIDTKIIEELDILFMGLY